jgi:hypothetical protein
MRKRLAVLTSWTFWVERRRWVDCKTEGVLWVVNQFEIKCFSQITSKGMTTCSNTLDKRTDYCKLTDVNYLIKNDIN